MGAKRKSAQGLPAAAGASSSSSSSPVPKEEDDLPAQTQFVPAEDDEDNLWSAIEILDERGKPKSGEYLVQWDGIDKSTGKPWKPTWEPKGNCTQALIDDWHERKAKNPTIVGREGAKLAEEEKAKATNKRKRRDSSRSLSKKAKPVVEVSSSKRGRTRRERRPSTFGPRSNSPDFPEPADISIETTPAGRNTRTRTRGDSVKDEPPTSSPAARAGLRNRQNTRTTTYEETSTDDDHQESPEESSFQPSSASKRTESEDRNSKTLLRRKSLAASARGSPLAKGGPGPSTAAHRSNASSPDKGAAVDTFRPSSDPSIMPARIVTREGKVYIGQLKLVATQASGSDPDSQADPVSQFSSPVRPQGTNVSRAVSAPTDSPMDPSQTIGNESAEGEFRKVDVGSQKDGKRFVIQTFRNGELVTKAISDSDDESPGPPAHFKAHGSTEAKPNGEFDDDDLADLQSDGQSEDPEEADNAVPRDQPDLPVGHEPDQALHSGLDNNHVDSQPDSSAATFPQTQEMPPPAVPTERHPDTIRLAEAHERIAALASQLQELNRRCEVLLHKQSPSLPVAQAVVLDIAPTAGTAMTAPCEEGEVTRAIGTGSDSSGNAPAPTSGAAHDAPPSPPSQSLSSADASLERSQIEEALKKEHEAELGRLRKEHAAENERGKREHEAEVGRLRNWREEEIRRLKTEHDAETERLTAKIEQMESDYETAEERRASLAEDNQFLRTQYAQASDRAVQEVRAAQDLRKQIAILKSQVTLGLKQRSVHHEKVARERENEARKLRAQVNLLLQQSRLTDDSVRMKATFYDRYKRERDGMQSSIEDLSLQVKHLQDRNEELSNLTEKIRAQRMGVIPSEEGESDFEPHVTASSDGSRASSPSVRRKNPKRKSAAAQGRFSLSAPTTDEARIAVRPGTIRLTIGEGYVCSWRDGNTECRAVCNTAEELHNHGVEHQRADIIARSGLSKPS
ncbi:hypothetical protein IAU59_006376 [Kwoniella sp. CBS 9459]